MFKNGLQQLGSGWVRTWWFWAFALLAIPNCSLSADGLTPDPCNGTPEQCNCESAPNCPTFVFQPGPTPNSDAIVCEYPAPVDPKTSDCATPSEIADVNNVSTSQAATALATNRHSSIALDWSDDAIAACGGPRKITFLDGQYPDGSVLCLNCGTQIDAMPPVYATKDKACSAKCQDLINNGNGFKPADVAAYCDKNAHTAPNYDKKICYHGACTPGGSPNPNFSDPRRSPEPVIWIDFDPAAIAVSGVNNNSLQRTAATSVPADFDAGAASFQTIASGDGWVDFSALETNLSHVLGVRESCDDPVNVCPDNVPGLDDIKFAISLNSNGQVYVIESGSPLTVFGPFGTYAVGERFRVKFVDNHDGTATISYVRIVGSCPDGTQCTEDPVTMPSMVKATYPLRVDATFREQNATLSNVRLVRIIPQ